MVAVDAPMDVLKQLPPLLKGNTALQDSSRALLIEFPIQQDKQLGPMCEASGLDLARGEHAMN
jgi:hypothetical protein